MSAQRLRDWALLLACNLIWASQFVLVKIVQRQMGPVTATFFPITGAVLLLIPLVRRQVRSRARASRMPRRDVLDFVALGVFGQVVAQLLITWGVRLSTASNAALLMLALPITTAVMAFFFLKERMTPVRWISFALALAGVVECSGIDWSELHLASRRFLLGNVLIFLSVNGSSFYNVYSKKLLASYSPLQVLLYSYYAMWTVLLPIALYAEPQGFLDLPRFTAPVWAGLAALSGLQYFLSMVLFLNVLKRLDATQASLSNYLIPFFGVVIAAVVLHERLTPFMMAGGTLVLASTLLITVYEERRRARTDSIAAG